jgi:hypothetical protein
VVTHVSDLRQRQLHSSRLQRCAKWPVDRERGLVDTFLLQDWVTIQGPGGHSLGGGNVSQAASQWLDLGPYQDVVILLQIAEGDGVSSLTLQTAPARDEILFANVLSINSHAVALPIVIPVQVGDSPTTPIARWFRWKIFQPTSSWFVTFRVTVMANCQGSQST